MLGLIFLLLLSAGVFSIIFHSILLGISPMPSSKKAKKTMLQAMPKEVKGRIYELGSGFGGLALQLSKKYPEAEILALELSLFPWLISCLRKILRGRKNVKFLRKDLLTFPLDGAKAVVCYLYPGAMTKLDSKFRKELRKNTTIVSNSFSLPGWKAKTILSADDLAATKIYQYLS